MATRHTFGLSFKHSSLLLRSPVTRSFQFRSNFLSSDRCLSVFVKPPNIPRPHQILRGFSDKPEKPNISLADQILSSKIASEAKDETKEDKNTKEESKEPMPKWQKYGYIFLGVLMGGSLVGNAILFSLPDQDEQGNNVDDEYSSLSFPSQHYNRLKYKIFTTKKAIEEPFSDKLLPDPLEPPYHQPKYTIVLGSYF